MQTTSRKHHQTTKILEMTLVLAWYTRQPPAGHLCCSSDPHLSPDPISAGAWPTPKVPTAANATQWPCPCQLSWLRGHPPNTEQPRAHLHACSLSSRLHRASQQLCSTPRSPGARQGSSPPAQEGRGEHSVFLSACCRMRDQETLRKREHWDRAGRELSTVRTGVSEHTHEFLQSTCTTVQFSYLFCVQLHFYTDCWRLTETFHKASQCLWKPSGGSWGGSGGSPCAHQHLTEVQGGRGRALLHSARTGGPGHGLGGAGGPRGELRGRLHLGPGPAVILYCFLYYHNSPDQGQPITFMAVLWPRYTRWRNPRQWIQLAEAIQIPKATQELLVHWTHSSLGSSQSSRKL